MKKTLGELWYPNFKKQTRTHALQASEFAQDVWAVWDKLSDQEKKNNWAVGLKVVASDAEQKALAWSEGSVLEDDEVLYKIGHIKVPDKISAQLPMLPVMEEDMFMHRMALLKQGHRDTINQARAKVFEEMNPHLIMVGGELQIKNV